MDFKMTKFAMKGSFFIAIPVVLLSLIDIRFLAVAIPLIVYPFIAKVLIIKFNSSGESTQMGENDSKS